MPASPAADHIVAAAAAIVPAPVDTAVDTVDIARRTAVALAGTGSRRAVDTAGPAAVALEAG